MMSEKQANGLPRGENGGGKQLVNNFETEFTDSRGNSQWSLIAGWDLQHKLKIGEKRCRISLLAGEEAYPYKPRLVDKTYEENQERGR